MSNTNEDIHCPLCRTVFNLFDDADIPSEREENIEAVRRACELMPPNVLAELVDYWLDDELEFAQIALDAGIRNCGIEELASYISNAPDYQVSPTTVMFRWSSLGLSFLGPQTKFE